MKRLIVMRHAKAERDSASGRDFDRDLTDRGIRDAILMAEVLRRYAIKPDLALVSPALRTTKTFETVAQTLSLVITPLSEQVMFNASAGTLRRLIEDEEDRAETLLVIAHNPGVADLCLQYLKEGGASAATMAKLMMGFPTAGMMVFTLDPAGRPLYDGLFIPSEHGGGAGE